MRDANPAKSTLPSVGLGADSPTFALDAAGVVRHWNAAATAWLGHGANEVLGRSAQGRIVPESGWAATLEVVRTAIEQGEQQYVEWRALDSAGLEHMLWSCVAPAHHDATGARVASVVCVPSEGRAWVERSILETLSTASQIASLASPHTPVLEGLTRRDAVCRAIVETTRSAFGFDRAGLWLLSGPLPSDPDAHVPLEGTFGTDDDGATVDERGFSILRRPWSPEARLLRSPDTSHWFVVQEGKRLREAGYSRAVMKGVDQQALIVLRTPLGPIGYLSVDNLISRRPLLESSLLRLVVLAQLCANAVVMADGHALYASPSGRGAVPDATGVPLGRLRVLVVDDEPLVGEVVAGMLRALGHEPVIVCSGHEAVELARQAGAVRGGAAFDAAVIDMVMPGMDGRRCYEALSEVMPGLRAIVSTGYDLGEVIVGWTEARELVAGGVLRFRQKPYSVDELRDALNELRGTA